MKDLLSGRVQLFDPPRRNWGKDNRFGALRRREQFQREGGPEFCFTELRLLFIYSRCFVPLQRRRETLKWTEKFSFKS